MEECGFALHVFNNKMAAKLANIHLHSHDLKQIFM